MLLLGDLGRRLEALDQLDCRSGVVHGTHASHIVDLRKLPPLSSEDQYLTRRAPRPLAPDLHGLSAALVPENLRNPPVLENDQVALLCLSHISEDRRETVELRLRERSGELTPPLCRFLKHHHRAQAADHHDQRSPHHQGHERALEKTPPESSEHLGNEFHFSSFFSRT